VCPGHSYVANGVVVHNCPFACGFCGGRNSKMLRKIRTRTTESIVGEIEHLYRTYGFTGYMLLDDELNVNKSIVELMNAIADLQARLGTEFRLRGLVKSELFTEEQAVAMYRAGFRWLLCGFEAGHPRILDNINKKATREDNTRVMEIAARNDLKVKALMSIGHPGESEETIRAVQDWLLEVKPADFDCTIITPFPGSPYYDEATAHESIADAWTYRAKRSGDRLHAFDVDYTVIADYYKGDPNGGYHSYVFTDHLTSEQIVKLRDEVERNVRATLGIPFYAAAPAKRFEHSMGQGELPGFILRTNASGTPTARSA
jgi:anaerobic magnesium-protoporphyrin IX monomethyl ester cyclase